MADARSFLFGSRMRGSNFQNATSNQLFQFNGELYEQTDGVAMGSPLGPLLANVFMCHIENQLEQNNMIPSFYRRYVDDTLVKMPNTESAGRC